MARSPYDADDDWDAAEELALIQNDERLPWLESGEEDDAQVGFDTTRVALVAALALLVLGAGIALVWFLTQAGGGAGPAPDGSVIAAPAGPYKTKPSDAGGKTFAGTGDTSFAVGEGQVREGKLADKPVLAPTAEPVAPRTAATPSLATTRNAPPAPAQPSGTGVQVGAFPTREDAEAGWTALLRETEVLAGVGHRVVEGSADIGRVYRLQAVTGDRASAVRLCGALKGEGIACFVK